MQSPTNMMFKVLYIAGLIALAQGYEEDYTYAPAPPSGPSPPAPSNSVDANGGAYDGYYTYADDADEVTSEVTSKTASAVQVTAGATMIAAIATLL